MQSRARGSLDPCALPLLCPRLPQLDPELRGHLCLTGAYPLVGRRVEVRPTSTEGAAEPPDHLAAPVQC